jgi:hypothetical protein
VEGLYAYWEIHDMSRGAVWRARAPERGAGRADPGADDAADGVGLRGGQRQLRSQSRAEQRARVQARAQPVPAWSDQLYFFGQLTTHLESEAGAPAETHIEIDNLLVNWTPKGATALSLSFGRFDAPIGFERDDEPLNLVPTTSFTFENARPGEVQRHHGPLRAESAHQLDRRRRQRLESGAGQQQRQDGGPQAAAVPGVRARGGGGVFYGPEEDSTNASPRTLLTGDATWQPLNRFIVQGEAHHGSQAGATWTGVVGQAFWRLGRQTGVTVRGEILDDGDGATTGTGQTLSSVTISPWYFFREAQEGVFSNVEFTTFRLPAFSLRPAVRFDHSDQPVFESKDGTLQQSNVTALVELVYLF